MAATSTSQDIVRALDTCYEELVWKDVANNQQERPHVCTVCDVFMKPCEVDSFELEKFCSVKEVLITTVTKGLPEDLKKCYQFHNVPFEYKKRLYDVLLSPRGRCCIPARTSSSGRRKAKGPCMSICKRCKRSLEIGEMPKFAISNGYFFGTPAPCLMELTDVERAWITPVQTFGIVYVFTGGPLQELKGTASFYKRNISSLANAAAKLDLLGLTKDGVSVVLLGSMTKAQIQKAKKKALIRPKKILEAIQWLICHNDDWKFVDMNKIKLALQKTNPIIVRDESDPADEVESNIESTETFRVYFPDGSLQTGLGGQQTCTNFLTAAIEGKATDDVSSGVTSTFLQAKFDKQRVHDYKDKNLVNACILQFPFGRGGLVSERRYGGVSGSYKVTHEEYIEHLSKISQPHFHHQLFTLILFNYLMKDWMVRKAAVACKNEHTAQLLGDNLTSKEFLEAVDQKRNKKKITSTSAQKMLSTLEAVAACAPHTNEAAKKAKYKIETMQCHFGLPSWFLTVTPDDENSVLLQVYSGQDIFNSKQMSWEQVENMSDKELADLGMQKRQLRYKYPGIAGFNFENQRDAIIKHVIGWDMENNCSTSVPGLFGKCEAFVLSVEEQGRKSLHMHILIWVALAQKAFTAIYNNKNKRTHAQFLCDEIDRVSSCELIGTCHRNKQKKLFHHLNCDKFNRVRRPTQPHLISAQRLRDLRNSEGWKKSKDHMKCVYCDKTFSSHEIIGNYLKDLGMEKLSSFPENKSKRLKAMAMALINDGGNDTRTKPIFNATYNHHIHTKISCFCKGNVKCSSVDCRYKHPKLPQHKTTLLDTQYTTDWYNFDGSYKPRSIFETAPKRNVTDVFMNQYCLGVGMTKLINGNTNVSLLTPGPVALYTTKYATKGTQKQDGKEFKYLSDRVLKAVHRLDIENLDRKEKERIGTITDADRKIANESAAITRVLRLGFNQHEPNIVGAPLASYLIRNKTRFVLSHEFNFAPIWNIETLLDGASIKRFFQRGRSGSYWGNSAYDYICRPTECEDFSLFEFTENFETVRQKPTKENELLSFVEVDSHIHPSWKPGKKGVGAGSYRAGIRMKDDTGDGTQDRLVQIPSYYLPDTATFNGNIMDVMSKETEEYSKKALLLFMPFRVLEDLRTSGPATDHHIALLEQQLSPNNSSEVDFLNELKDNGSFTETFRDWLGKNKKSHTKQHAIQFLQNFQDCSYNCTRKSRIGDELDRQTQKYQSRKDKDGAKEDDESCSLEEGNTTNDDTEGYCFLNETELAKMVELLCPEKFLETNETKQPPSHYLTRNIKDKGKFMCGYEHIALMNPFQCAPQENTTTEREPWIEINGSNANAKQPASKKETAVPDPLENPSKDEVLQIIVKKTNRVVRTGTMFKPEAQVREANGSAESIVAWSKNAKLDRTQQVAFEMIIASFVLTFFEEEDDSLDGDGHQMYSVHKAKLQKLADVPKRGSQQLIALLYGAGGAGKSYVIDLVMLYAKEYCSKFADFVFDKRTIVVTAVTGCAATLLNGETVHGALNLNTKLKNLDQDDIDAWKRTRLIIIDEISFASEETMKDINERLRLYRDIEETDPTLFGGIHMVVAGDFRQLDPVGLPALYETAYQLELKVNCFLELTGMHRFKNDLAWGNLLKKFRDGTVDKADIDKLNRHIVKNNEHLPDNLKYATYRNADRDAINAALFDKAVGSKSQEEAPKFGLLVFADEIHLKTGKNCYSKRLGTCNRLYQEKSESDIIISGKTSKRMDPVLKLYEGIRVLLTQNEDVLNGIANGTQAEVVRIVLKTGETYGTTTVHDGNGTSRMVKAVFASQIDYIELRHMNDRVAIPLFKLKPQEFIFKTMLPSPTGEREIGMKAVQLPIIVNNATTGHKLQGSTVDSIFVHTWSTKRNWNYVVLSRVREMKGLFARKKLPCKLELYKVPKKLDEMLHSLRTYKIPSEETTRHP